MVKRMMQNLTKKNTPAAGNVSHPALKVHFKSLTEKRRLIRRACYGMGFCVGLCPEGAISVEEKHTVKFNREKTELRPRKKIASPLLPCGARENTNHLLPLRHKMESLWVCTH